MFMKDPSDVGIPAEKPCAHAGPVHGMSPAQMLVERIRIGEKRWACNGLIDIDEASGMLAALKVMCHGGPDSGG